MAANKNENESGNFPGLYVRYTDILLKVESKNKESVLQFQFFRFLIMWGLLMAAIELNTRVTHDYQCFTAMQESYGERKFLSPVKYEDGNKDTKYHNHATIATHKDFWSWMKQIVVPETFDFERKMSGQVGQKLKKARYVAGGQNQLLWGVRLRQQRVMQAKDISNTGRGSRLARARRSCPISSVILQAGVVGPQDCIPHYDAISSDNNPYGGIILNKTTGTYFKNQNKSLYEWKNDVGAGTSSPGGYYTHGNDGYVVDLLATSTRAEIDRQIRGLICDPTDPVDLAPDGSPLWSENLIDRTKCIPFIDNRTAGIFVLIQVYNPNSNVFARFEAATVMPLAGKFHNEIMFHGGHLVTNKAKYYKPQQQVFWSWILLLCMVLEILLWMKEFYFGKIYFSSVAVLDFIVHVLSVWFIVDVISDNIFDYTDYQLEQKLAVTDNVEDLFLLLDRKMESVLILAWLAMALILQFFKYLGVLNRRLQIVYNTLLRVISDLIYWFALLSIVILGLVVSGNTFFGSDTEDFSTFFNSLNSIFRLIIMDFQFEGISQASVFLGIPFYVMALVVIYFLLLNIFTTIVLRSWDVERTYYLEEQENEVVDTKAWTFSKIIMYIVKLQWAKDLCIALKDPVYYCNKIAEIYRERTAQMPPEEVAIRLQAWHSKRENAGKQFIEFIDVKEAMEGALRVRRIVTNYQVQIVMRYCQQKNEGDLQLLFTVRQKAELEREAQGLEDELAEKAEEIGDENQLDEVAAMKQLVRTICELEKYQNGLWDNVNDTLKKIQIQTRESKRRARFVKDRLDKLIPKVGFHGSGAQSADKVIEEDNSARDSKSSE